MSFGHELINLDNGCLSIFSLVSPPTFVIRCPRHGGFPRCDFVRECAIRALGEKIGEARNWVIPMQVRLQMELQLSVNGFLSAGCLQGAWLMSIQ